MLLIPAHIETEADEKVETVRKRTGKLRERCVKYNWKVERGRENNGSTIKCWKKYNGKVGSVSIGKQCDNVT